MFCWYSYSNWLVLYCQGSKGMKVWNCIFECPLANWTCYVSVWGTTRLSTWFLMLGQYPAIMLCKQDWINLLSLNILIKQILSQDKWTSAPPLFLPNLLPPWSIPETTFCYDTQGRGWMPLRSGWQGLLLPDMYKDCCYQV